MKNLHFKGRAIVKGRAEGEAIVSPQRISFYGGINPETGVVIEQSNPLAGRSISDKVFVFPGGKGSTVGSYTLMRMKRNSVSPVAMICRRADSVVAVGCVLAEIPFIDCVSDRFFEVVRDEDSVVVDGARELVIVHKRR